MDVADRISAFIKDNTQPGDKLPSYREFAELFGVSTRTVGNAIERLHYKGLIDIRPQSGIFVMQDAWKTYMPKSFDWQEYFRRSKKLPIEHFKRYPAEPRPTLSRIILTGDDEGYAYFNKAFREALDSSTAEHLTDYSTRGDSLLRNELVRYMSYNGVELGADNILVTRGAVLSLLSIIMTFFPHGSTCYYVSPSSFAITATLDLTGFEKVAVPAGDDGIDLEYLSSKINRRNRAFLLIMPVLHTISGKTMSLQKRRDLYNLCYANDIPVIEIDEYRDLSENPLPPVKAFDKRGIVFYIGGFSKVMTQALDVAWIAASQELIERLRIVHTFIWFGHEILLQKAMSYMLANGDYRKYTAGLRKTIKSRRAAVNDILEENLGDIATWDRNSEFFFWLRFHDYIDVHKMSQSRIGLDFTNSSQYEFAEKNAIFISIIGIKTGDFEKAVKQLSLLARKSLTL